MAEPEPAGDENPPLIDPDRASAEAPEDEPPSEDGVDRSECLCSPYGVHQLDPTCVKAALDTTEFVDAINVEVHCVLCGKIGLARIETHEVDW